MVAYELHCRDPTGGCQIIGVLPERRKKPERITQESILNWGEKIFGRNLNTEDIFSIQVAIDDETLKTFRPIPFTITYKEIQNQFEESKIG
jgi:hypothetical protein